jgi:hypothetical protein
MAAAPAATRVWLHRWGSLAVPGAAAAAGPEPPSSSAAAHYFSAADGVVWRHVLVEVDGGRAALGLGLGGGAAAAAAASASAAAAAAAAAAGEGAAAAAAPGAAPGAAGSAASSSSSSSSSSASASASAAGGAAAEPLPGGGTLGRGLRAFIAAATAQLEAQLAQRGRALDRTRCTSLQAAPAALIAFARACGAHEVHAIASRDPWALEADAALRQQAAAEGIAVSAGRKHQHRAAAPTAAAVAPIERQMSGRALCASAEPPAAARPISLHVHCRRHLCAPTRPADRAARRVLPDPPAPALDERGRGARRRWRAWQRA